MTDNLTVPRELLRQVLVVLAEVDSRNALDIWDVSDALRTALEQPAVEPYGHVTVRRLSQRFENHTDQYTFYPAGQVPYLDNADECIAVYTAPQAQQSAQVKWGVDWGSHGDRSCVSIIKKHANGALEVIATEYGPVGSAPQAQQPARIGSGVTVEQTLEQWEHDFNNPMTPEQQADWVKREREFAARQAQQPVPQAVQTLIAAMQADSDYAWSWHCNIAMAYVDAGGDTYIGNQGAARFMKLFANVDPAHELPAQQPRKAVKLTDEQIERMSKVGPVYAPDGWVERRPDEYRREIEGAIASGIRIAEQAHGITGESK